MAALNSEEMLGLMLNQGKYQTLYTLILFNKAKLGDYTQTRYQSSKTQLQSPGRGKQKP